MDKEYKYLINTLIWVAIAIIIWGMKNNSKIGTRLWITADLISSLLFPLGIILPFWLAINIYIYYKKRAGVE